MVRPQKPDNETQRLEALRRYRILDTPAEDAFDDLVRIASAVCAMPMGAVTLVDADRQWIKAKLGISGEDIPREEAFCAHAILRADEVMVVPDARADDRFHDNPLVVDGPGIRFYAGAPLLDSEGQALGALCVMDHEPRELEPYQIEALDALSRQVSRLMELRQVSHNLNLLVEDRAWYEEQLLRYQAELEAHNADLAEQTRTDPLTGLPNRRAFAAATEALRVAGRGHAIAIIDIDHFKQVNDLHGHATGDRVLVDLADLLRAASGGRGTVARIGGEEFVWLMPGAEAMQAELACRHLCQSVRLSSMALPVTISVGLALSRGEPRLEDVLARADEALYRAKRNGRDRVEIAA